MSRVVLRGVKYLKISDNMGSYYKMIDFYLVKIHP